MTKVSKKLPGNIERHLNKIMDDVTRALDGDKFICDFIIKTFRYVYKKWEKKGYDVSAYKNHDEEILQGKKSVNYADRISDSV